MAEYFREIPDPWCARKHKHSHVDILLVIVLGFLAGKNSLRRIVKWAKRNQEKLKKNLALKNGISSLSTFSRIASGIVRCYTNDEAIGKIRKELPFIRSVASSCQVRIPKEVDADGKDVTLDKETFLKQGSQKCPKPTEGDGFTDQIQKRPLADFIRRLFLSASFSKDTGNTGLPVCLLKFITDEFYHTLVFLSKIGSFT